MELIYGSSVTVEEFEHKYIHYSARLYRMALSLLDNSQDAEDVVHDVFLKLWGKRDVLSSLDNVEFYIITVLRNSCVDCLRKRRYNVDERVLELMLDDALNPEQLLEEECRRRLVREWMKSNLPKKMSRVLILRLYAEMDIAEIASVVGETEVNVRSILSRGRKRLMEQCKYLKEVDV